MPLVSKTFDQLLDFTRTSSATFVGSNGLIQNTAASRNLLLQTQQFDNAAWTKSNTTVTANSTTAPDGTSTADKLIEDTVNLTHEARQLVAVAATPHTYSSYFKAGERSFAMLFVNTLNVGTVFDLSNGTTAGNAGFTAPTAASITSVGNGWYRCSITVTTTAASLSFRVYIMQNSTTYSYTGDGTSGIFAWGAQLEAASAATTYTRNNGGVFPPRFDYDPVTLAAKGLLIEEQRTNLATYSEQLDNAAWVKVNTTVTANATASPDGTVDADKIIPTATSAAHQTAQASGTLAVGTVYTASAFVKAAGYNFVDLTGNTPNANFLATFNLSTGSVVSSSNVTGTPTIQNFGNGWYRIVASFTCATATGGFCYIQVRDNSQALSYAGDGTSGVFAYGAQLEAGAFATSYIPTVASQVTRTNDLTSIVAPNFAPWFNPSEGTFVFEGTVLGSTGFSWPLVASDNTAANRLGMYRSGIAVAGFIIASNVTQMEVATTSVVANVPFKIGVTAQANSGNFSFNGNIGTTDTSITMPIVNRLSIGASASGSSEYFNGHIRSIRYYPTRLTNAQLQALTA